MCGICGFLGEGAQETLIKMTDALTHRGPDEYGYYYKDGIALGHRRLKIIDLISGQQPFFSQDKKYVIVFNGEIYNFKELRTLLKKKKYNFNTSSDTEVLLNAYIEWGADCLNKFNGMFAFVIVNLETKKIFAGRDRFGKKPFYYFFENNNFIFASELTAVLKHPLIKKTIDLCGLKNYLFYEYTPAPYSMIEKVNKLPAGAYLELNNSSLQIKKYWDIKFNAADSNIPQNEIEIFFLRKLKAAVEKRLISDVPLGVFLSGGIDSSSIVALMSELIPAKNIKTFSIGFEEKSFDESSYAQTTANFFGTDHREQKLNPSIMIDIIPEIFGKLDEPMADSSIIPTYLLSKFTRQYVTVALGGDGGDELLAGYDPFTAHYFLRGLRLPKSIIKILAALSHNLFGVSDENMSIDFKLRHLLRGLSYDIEQRNEIWLGAFLPEPQKKLLMPEISSNNYNVFTPVNLLDTANMTVVQKVIYCYTKLYLQDDILTKIDRASMMNSLEARAPFLDIEFAEFVNGLPDKYKIRYGCRKYLLKKVMKNKLPRQILNRAKKGFGIPIAKWFKNELKHILYDTLSPAKIKNDGFFDAEYIQKIMNDHCSNKNDYRKELWVLFTFQMWRDKMKYL